MSIVNVCVTQEDIDQGESWNPYACPVALAVRRATGAAYVSVGGAILLGDSYLSAKFAREVTGFEAVGKFVDAFDRGQPVQPFEFVLELPA